MTREMKAESRQAENAQRRRELGGVGTEARTTRLRLRQAVSRGSDIEDVTGA